MKTKIIALMAAGLLVMSLVGPAFALKGGIASTHVKTEICHVDGKADGSMNYTLIEVADSAVDTHVPGHPDDLLIGDEVDPTDPEADGIVTEEYCLAMGS